MEKSEADKSQTISNNEEFKLNEIQPPPMSCTDERVSSLEEEENEEDYSDLNSSLV